MAPEAGRNGNNPLPSLKILREIIAFLWNRQMPKPGRQCQPGILKPRPGTGLNRRRASALALMPALLLLISCNEPATPTPFSPGTRRPTVSPEPTCYLLPQPTGEKIIELEVTRSPPLQVAPGQRVIVSFSGGYVIFNNARVCGESNVVGYVHSDELPGYSYERTVRIRLDDEFIAETECGMACAVSLEIPEGIAHGKHRIEVRPRYGWRNELTFEIEVLPAE